jgi:hypothetical protein
MFCLRSEISIRSGNEGVHGLAGPLGLPGMYLCIYVTRQVITMMLRWH